MLNSKQCDKSYNIMESSSTNSQLCFNCSQLPKFTPKDGRWHLSQRGSRFLPNAGEFPAA